MDGALLLVADPFLILAFHAIILIDEVVRVLRRIDDGISLLHDAFMWHVVVDIMPATTSASSTRHADIHCLALSSAATH